MDASVEAAFEQDTAEELKWFDYSKISPSSLIVIIHPNPERSVTVIRKIKRQFDFYCGDTFTTDPWRYKDTLGEDCKSIDQCTTSHATEVFGRQGGNFVDKPLSAHDRHVLSTLDTKHKVAYLKQLVPLHHLPRDLLSNLSENIYNTINSYLLIPDAYLILHSGIASTFSSHSGDTQSSKSSSSYPFASKATAGESKVTNDSGSHVLEEGELIPEDEEDGELEEGEIVKISRSMSTVEVGNDRGMGIKAPIWKQAGIKRCLYQLGKRNALLRIIAVHSPTSVPPKLLAEANCIFVFTRDEDELKKIYTNGKLIAAVPSRLNFIEVMLGLGAHTGLVFHRTERTFIDTKTGVKKVNKKHDLYCTTDITRMRGDFVPPYPPE